MTTQRVALDAILVENFANAYLSPMFDEAKPTPEFHRACWRLYTEAGELAAVAAPRGHAKSTALSHSFVLACCCFHAQDYIVMVSATEDLAMNHLGDIARQLRDNVALAADFGPFTFLTDSKSDVVVRDGSGHTFRIVAKGSGQKMRGMLWDGKRPGLIVCDDLEEDETVANKESRGRFSRWFNRALLPCLRRGGWCRVHGTILHDKSLLAKIMKSPAWRTLFFKAHRSYDDFSDILWPEQFDETMLRRIRQNFIDDHDPSGYSQEYLNTPRDSSETYINREGFLPMTKEDFARPKHIRVGCDFAVSKKKHANKTSFAIGGKCTQNLIHIMDVRADRWSTDQWIDKLFELQELYEPEVFDVEGGVIWSSVWPIIQKEMQARDRWLVFNVLQSVTDKATRGRTLQKRHRAGQMRYNVEAEWFPAYEDELLGFRPDVAGEDDSFDSTSILMRGFETAAEVEVADFYTEDELELLYNDPRDSLNRSSITGY